MKEKQGSANLVSQNWKMKGNWCFKPATIIVDAKN